MMGMPPHASRTGHWAQINESTCIAGIHFLFWICRIFGKWPFRIMLYPVLGWYLIAKPDARAASSNYLLRVNAFATRRLVGSGFNAVFVHFASFAESILEKLLLWSGLFEIEKVNFFGHQPLIGHIAERKGCLLICSHLGNLELCRVLSRHRPGLKMTVLVHTKHAPAFDRLLKQIDPDSQLDLMQVTEISPVTAILLAEKIRQGEFVVVAGDRISVSPNPRVAMARFLGKSAPFPVGPYILGSILQCPVYLMFSMRTGATSEIHFELFRESILLPRKGRNEILAGLVADYAARLEHYCVKEPMQWFNFYDFWQLPNRDINDATRFPRDSRSTNHPL
jgi:predicted LPLAT superfamily acyltransferase